MESDKAFWHQYIPEYERLVFSGLRGQMNIMEFGVALGASTEFLLHRFPEAMVFGVDIIEQQAEWPKSSRVFYINLDQSNRAHLSSMYTSLNKQFDLIIDDGSHRPLDQAITLFESLPWIRPKGFYILEDIHTSYAERKGGPNIFHILLAIQHLKATKKPLSNSFYNALATDYITASQIDSLYHNLELIHLYKRTSLPLACYRCLTSSYDYLKLRCKSCGADLYKDDDSMSFILKKV